jgi:hypothetical protein
MQGGDLIIGGDPALYAIIALSLSQRLCDTLRGRDRPVPCGARLA